jgi:hypothetical protein
MIPSCDPSKPLWMPDGSVRAIMTLGAVFIAGLLLILGVQVPEWYVGLITLVVNSYFNSRSDKP